MGLLQCGVHRKHLLFLRSWKLSGGGSGLLQCSSSGNGFVIPEILEVVRREWGCCNVRSTGNRFVIPEILEVVRREWGCCNVESTGNICYSLDPGSCQEEGVG